MKTRYIEDVMRMSCSFFDIKAWYEGESNELKNVLGFGFYNTIFAVEKGNVTLYYTEKECEEFYKILDKKLTEDFFNNLCDNFFKLMKKSEEILTNQEIFELIIKCWPALVIFEEISNYPGYASDSMLRRLIRVRKSTEAFSYDLAKRLKLKFRTPKNYLFFRGKIINKTFEDFIKENNIEITK